MKGGRYKDDLKIFLSDSLCSNYIKMTVITEITQGRMGQYSCKPMPSPWVYNVHVHSQGYSFFSGFFAHIM
jgi:hypothetical protein